MTNKITLKVDTSFGKTSEEENLMEHIIPLDKKSNLKNRRKRSSSGKHVKIQSPITSPVENDQHIDPNPSRLLTAPLSPREVRKARHSVDLVRDGPFLTMVRDPFLSSTDSTSTDANEDICDSSRENERNSTHMRQHRPSESSFTKLRRSLSRKSFKKALDMGLVEVPSDDDALGEDEKNEHNRLLKKTRSFPMSDNVSANAKDMAKLSTMQQCVAGLRLTGRVLGLLFYSIFWIFSLVLNLGFVVTSVLGIIWYTVQFVLLRMIRYVLDFSWKRKQRHANLESSYSYEEWACTQLLIEKTNGAEEWRSSKTSEAGLYDCDIVSEHVKDLESFQDALADYERNKGKQNSVMPVEILDQMEDHLKPFMCRHNSNLDDARLHCKSDLGTKYDIEEYLDMGEALLDKYTQALLNGINGATRNGRSLSVPSKRIKKLRKWQKALGETALCLSGGGMAAMAHLGVVKALIEGGCLPRVISGSSGGSVMAMFLAIHTDEEILSEICKPELMDTCKENGNWLPGVWEKVTNLFKIGVLVDSEQLASTYRNYVKDFTFAEAFARTGRQVNIAVTRADMKGYPTVLNHITAPDVFLWSAFCATCCVPGLMHPIELKAKKSIGPGLSGASTFEVVAAYKKGIRWVDGSLAGDLPTQFLRRQFNCNQFIVSQVNPHIAPFLLARKDTNVSDFIYRLELGLGESIGFCFSTLAKNGLIPELFGQGLGGIALQRYGDDNHDTILVLPKVSLGQYMRALETPTVSEAAQYIRNGELAIWPRLAQIEHRMRVEMKLRRCLERISATSCYTNMDDA
eukprot:Nk52_evm31s163 gene=Nk52_evmTU31s163